MYKPAASQEQPEARAAAITAGTTSSSIDSRIQDDKQDQSSDSYSSLPGVVEDDRHSAKETVARSRDAESDYLAEDLSPNPRTESEIESEDTQTEPEGSAKSTQRPKNGPGKKKRKKRRFGLAYANKEYPPLDDYEVKYPPDKFGREMDPGARVWRVYLDEAGLNDTDMVEAWKDGIDVLLVFAGLFSAVVTTFVAQTSTKLDKDYGQISASLLTELIAIQRAIATSSSLADVQPSELTFSSPPQYDDPDVWVNGLWFTSLTLSLATALFAVLIKQWVQHYTSFVSGTALERARIHQFRYLGLERWGVHAIIGVLPLLLYMALFLFILGLAIFLKALKPSISYVVIAIGSAMFMVYVITNGLPVFYPGCPYRTPLIDHILAAISFVIFGLRLLPSALKITFIRLRTGPLIYIQTRLNHSDMEIDHLTFMQNHEIRTLKERHQFTFKYKPLKVFESEAAEVLQDKMVQKIIEWLLTFSSNPSVKPIALESISGLRVGFSGVSELLGEGSLTRRELFDELRRREPVARNLDNATAKDLITDPQFYSIERIFRATIFAPNYHLQSFGDNGEFFPSTSFSFAILADNYNERKASGEDTSISEEYWLFYQALATYRVFSNSFFEHPGPSSYLEQLSRFAPTSSAIFEQYPAAWKAWCIALSSSTRAKGWLDPIRISSVHVSMGPLCERLFAHNTSREAWGILLPFICDPIPPDFIEKIYGSRDAPYQHEPLVHSSHLKFRLMVLYRVTMELQTCVVLPQDMLQLEGVVRDSCDELHFDISLYVDESSTIVHSLAKVLDDLVGDREFAKSHWKQDTYESLFKAYFQALSHASAPPPSSTLSAHLVRYCFQVDVLCHTTDRMIDISPEHLIMLSHIANCIRQQKFGEGVINSVLEGFVGLPNAKRHDLYHSRPFELDINVRQWSFHAQPLIRWMLDCFIDHTSLEGNSDPSTASFATLDSESNSVQIPMPVPVAPPLNDFGTIFDPPMNSNPSMNSFATFLDNHKHLAFFCSSFLIDCRRPHTERVVLSEDSYVLGRLAEYCNKKYWSSAGYMWGSLFSWIKDQSSEIRDNEYCHDSWTRADFYKYEGMANLVDLLMSTLGISDIESLRVPRFEEDYIVEFLKKKERPLYLDPPSSEKAVASSSRSRAVYEPNGDGVDQFDLESNDSKKGNSGRFKRIFGC